MARTYNAGFRATSLNVNGTNNIPLTYDLDGLLTGAGSLTIGRSVQNGFVTSATLGGISTAYAYNSFGELVSERHTGAGSVLYDVAYTRDKLGRITQRVETVGGVASTYGYVYDAAGRLVQGTKNGTVISAYAYDQNGNRLGKTDSIGTTVGTYDAQDRLLTYGANSYSYTANGELQSKTNANGTTSYNYDVLGNLTAVTMPDGTLIEYVIDGANRRVGKKVNGVLVQGFLYANQLNPVAELDGAGNVVATFIYGTKSNVPDYMVKGGVTYRIISNHLGSPVLVVDSATGTVAQQITYDEFGNVLTDTNPGFAPFGFAGGLYDHQTKLIRFGARDYDSETGRWTGGTGSGNRVRSCFVVSWFQAGRDLPFGWCRFKEWRNWEFNMPPFTLRPPPTAKPVYAFFARATGPNRAEDSARIRGRSLTPRQTKGRKPPLRRACHSLSRSAAHTASRGGGQTPPALFPSALKIPSTTSRPDAWGVFSLEASFSPSGNRQLSHQRHSHFPI